MSEVVVTYPIIFEHYSKVVNKKRYSHDFDEILIFRNLKYKLAGVSWFDSVNDIVKLKARQGKERKLVVSKDINS